MAEVSHPNDRTRPSTSSSGISARGGDSAPSSIGTNVTRADQGSNVPAPTGLWPMADSDQVSQTDTVDNTKATTNIAPGFAQRFAAPSEEGEAVSNELAEGLTFLMTSKLEEKHLMETFQQYLKPANCDFLQVPKVNPIVWDNLSPKVRSTDLKGQRIQKPLVTGLTALVHSIESRKDKSLLKVDQDILAMLANAYFEMNALRGELIKPDLNQKYSHLCKPSVKPTVWG
ncbi:hypothetical protein HOLleu_42743 [Holothuria leucospilota]|uniref:Uncharacterized protein n=1 Tax=Holothuria leucospilota TaxID=206669 RepID=A0A9Q1B9Z9_HOLLE|nr:hypothetical protein HOLleu_42743 [Holothuria leucospilota]